MLVSFDGLEPVTLCLCSQKAMKFLLLWAGFSPCSITWGFIPRICEVLSVERISAPAGVAPEALEEWKHSSKGCEHNVCMVDWVSGPLSIHFSRPRHYFSRHRRSFQLAGRPSSIMNQFKQLTERARGPVCRVGLHHRAAAGSFEGTASAEACEEPPSPSPHEGDQGNPRLTVTTLGLPFRKEEG